MTPTPCPYCRAPASAVIPTTHVGTPGVGRVVMAYCRECRASGPWRPSAELALAAWREVERRGG